MKQFENPVLSHILMDNERHTNRKLSVLLFISVFYPFLNLFFLQLDESPRLEKVNSSLLIPIAILTLSVLAIAYLVHFRGGWVKNMLFIMLQLNCAIYYGLFPSYSTYLLLIPPFVASKYFDRKYVRSASISNICLFLFICIFGIFADKTIPVIGWLHELSSYNPWIYPRDTFSYIIFPVILASIFASVFACSISDSGYFLIEAQAGTLKRISAMDTELSMAARVQIDTLPPRAFSTQNGFFSIHASVETAREVGGDFYDYFPLPGQLMAVIIADVSDKGFSAAMFMMSAKKALRCALECSHSLREAITLANRLICEDNQGGMFLTLWLGVVDLRSGDVRYINAGHLPPYLRHQDGSADQITNEPDLFIGNFPEMVPAVHFFRMRKGDTLVLYTDGITDSMNEDGDHFGDERLRNALSGDTRNPEELLGRIVSASKTFAENTVQFDDMTMLLLHCANLEKPEALSIEVPASGEGITRLQNDLQSFLTGLGLPETEKNNIGVVTDEICSNIADYAYPDGAGSIQLEASVCGHCCELRFSDSGTPFDPLGKESSLPDQPQIGGYGIFLVKKLCSQMSYERVENRNVLTAKLLWDF